MGVLFLVKDVVCCYVGSHVPQKGVILFPMVHRGANSIAGGLYTGLPCSVTFGLLLQQQEGYTTIPVVLGLEVLNELPAIAVNCKILQVIEEQLIVPFKDRTTQLN